MKTIDWYRSVRGAALGLLLVAGANAVRAASQQVLIQGFAFVPPEVSVNVGESVTWTQKDTIQHTSTSDGSPPVWSSPLLSVNQTFSFTFTAAGTYAYHCGPHPFMKGSVTVVAQATTNNPPVVQITGPANGAAFDPSNSITLTATASDTDGSISQVEFFDGAVSLGTAMNAPYSVTVGNLAIGSHTLTAKATDNQGASTVSDAVMISITNSVSVPPSVNIVGVDNLPNAVTITWTGGAGPYLLQKKADLTDTNWFNVLTTSSLYVTVAKDAQSGFYRVTPSATHAVTPFTVVLDGPSEVPATTSGGTGIGALSLEGMELSYYISYRGLTTNATAAHIHGPADADTAAGVLFPLNGFSGTAGVLTGTMTLTADQLADVASGMAYANIHTAIHPGGEIRGQVVPLRIPVNLTTVAEVPTVTGSAGGSGYITLVGTSLYYDIDFGGLSGPATAAHIHGPADATHAAGVEFPLAGATGTSGTLEGEQKLTSDQLTNLLAGFNYVNIHTGNNPGGEIRGQVVPWQFTATLSGAAEVPAVASSGTGSGTLSIIGNVLTYSIAYSGLSSAASASHIHGPANTTQAAGVLFPLNGAAGTSGTLSGTQTLTSDQLANILTGNAYVNIHTANHPGGEIRGQILPQN